MRKILCILYASILLHSSCIIPVMAKDYEDNRMYYCDIYYRNSIVSFVSSSLDSILMYVRSYIVPAQVISVYSYTQNPYEYNQEYIFGFKEISSITLESTPNRSRAPLGVPFGFPRYKKIEFLPYLSRCRYWQPRKGCSR